MHKVSRRLPVGAELGPDGVHFRVWAPASRKVTVVSGDAGSSAGSSLCALEAEGDGYFSGFAAGIGAGALYKLQLDSRTYPDPASRFQPDGPHGASQVIDPTSYRWKDSAWQGAGFDGQVLYEFHIGTF